MEHMHRAPRAAAITLAVLALPAAVLPSEPSQGTPAAASVVLEDVNRQLPTAIRERAQRLAQEFIAFCGLPVERTIVVPLRYFLSEAAFRDYADRNFKQNLPVQGYYDPRKREIVVSHGDYGFGLLYHEMTHFLLDALFEDAPAWLHEGLAEYIQTADLATGAIAVRDRPDRRRHLAEWLAQGREPALRELLDLNWRGWMNHDEARGDVVRALSWSIVDFLLDAPDGRQRIQSLMATLKEQRGLHSLQAFDRTFPGGAAAFEQRWLAHVEALAR